MRHLKPLIALSSLCLLGGVSAYAICMDQTYCGNSAQATTPAIQVPAMVNLMWQLPFSEGSSSIAKPYASNASFTFSKLFSWTDGSGAEQSGDMIFSLTQNTPPGQDNYSVTLPNMGVVAVNFTNNRRACTVSFTPASGFDTPAVTGAECSNQTQPLQSAALTPAYQLAISTQLYGAAKQTTKLLAAIQSFGLNAQGQFNGYLQHNCGGSLIDATHVLTAAHCVSNDNDGEVGSLRSPSQLWVTVGNTWNAQSTLLAVTQINRQTSEYYNSYADRDHDFAILTLAQPVPNIAPFRIAQGAQNVLNFAKQYGADTGSQLYIAGFGQTSPVGNAGPAMTLNYGAQQYIDASTSNSLCQTMLNNADFDPTEVTPNLTLCAGTPQVGSNLVIQGMAATCPGDSGGALFAVLPSNGDAKLLAPVDWVPQNGVFVALGVDSFTGIGCVSVTGSDGYTYITPTVRGNAGALCDSATEDGQWFASVVGQQNVANICYTLPATSGFPLARE